ncbi:uncharacterized protein V1510DRAFT_310132 [Dipodascopsis tothii]|uniref:uncharacterized protein n=1 Tax=Dipodascopsis tothii TaxID=44089 RepID=UPI0034CD6D94
MAFLLPYCSFCDKQLPMANDSLYCSERCKKRDLKSLRASAAAAAASSSPPAPRYDLGVYDPDEADDVYLGEDPHGILAPGAYTVYGFQPHSLSPSRFSPSSAASTASPPSLVPPQLPRAASSPVVPRQRPQSMSLTPLASSASHASLRQLSSSARVNPHSFYSSPRSIDLVTYDPPRETQPRSPRGPSTLYDVPLSYSKSPLERASSPRDQSGQLKKLFHFGSPERAA